MSDHAAENDSHCSHLIPNVDNEKRFTAMPNAAKDACPHTVPWGRFCGDCMSGEQAAEIDAAHNHVTRDIKPPGACPGCDHYHGRHNATDCGLSYSHDPHAWRTQRGKVKACDGATDKRRP